MNTAYDPCENFYQYSCGHWYNPRPGASQWGTANELALSNYHKIAGYLSSYASDRDPSALRKAKYIYSACTNTDYIQDNLLIKIKDFMIYKAGGWRNAGLYPVSSWSINSLYKDHYLGSTAFFQFWIGPDDLNSSLSVIRIRQAGLTYGSPEKYFGDDFDQLTTTIQRILNALDYGGSHYTTAYDIAHFERTLAAHWLTETELRNVSALYNPMTLEELSRIFSMNWVDYFNQYFAMTGYSGSFSSSTVVIVETPSYFRAVNSYLSRSVVLDYAKWQLLVSELSLYVASLPQDNWNMLREIKFPKTSKLSEDTKLTCVELVETAMPLAVARPFVEEFITGTTRTEVAEVITQMKTAFKQRIKEKTWLDNTTKAQVIGKVDAITDQVAYPDFIKIDSELDSYYSELSVYQYENYFDVLAAIRRFVVNTLVSRYFHPIDKTQWLDAPTEVNAYYTAQFNQFVILAGILRPPFYSANWSPFLLYGALGTAIGHELTHGFDDQGQQYNKYGNRVQWWTDQSIANFKERAQCFVNQYGRYQQQGHRIDGRLTLGENIADNGGVHTAYRAYKNAMIGIADQTVQGHSGDQLFFVAFAQLWCSTFTSDYLESSIHTDPHSPGPIRVFGSLVNSPEFATAFHCSRRSRMHPRNNRCELW
ncbi:endothelin-converting enzyme homolog [Dysidea avara]|uniref:endothelin-converting enzyme homolog n=1 Tax=Dysidea avara TaxID=196820 RepID=UPI0033181929